MKLKKRELRIRMAQRGYFTYAALAEEMGVTRAAVSQWASGENSISLENISKLCVLLACQPSDLTDEYPNVFARFTQAVAA